MKDNKKIKQKEDLWNFIFSLIFIFIFSWEIFLLKNKTWEINVTEIVILSLALFRMIRLAVYDKVTQFFRDWFLKVSFTEDGKVLREKHSYGFKSSVSDILSCPWCSSIWIALFLLPIYIIFKSETMIFASIMALSGIASFLLFFTHYIRAKLENEESKK